MSPTILVSPQREYMNLDSTGAKSEPAKTDRDETHVRRTNLLTVPFLLEGREHPRIGTITSPGNIYIYLV